MNPNNDGAEQQQRNDGHCRLLQLRHRRLPSATAREPAEASDVPSRLLTPAQERYAMIEKRLLGHFACAMFHTYMYGLFELTSRVHIQHNPLSVCDIEASL